MAGKVPFGRVVACCTWHTSPLQSFILGGEITSIYHHSSRKGQRRGERFVSPNEVVKSFLDDFFRGNST